MPETAPGEWTSASTVKQFEYRATPQLVLRRDGPGRVNSSAIDTHFHNWVADLEKRHLADLTFAELSRALRALSSTYVERRHRLAEGGAFSGAGKRAAFALFYAPLHFLLVDHIARELRVDCSRGAVVDLGCGTGAGGAALRPHFVTGVDKSSWALTEAARTYRAFGIAARTHRGDVTGFTLPKRPTTMIAAFTMNEMADGPRDALIGQLLERAETHGDRVLIVEPLAKGVARWWDAWRRRFESAGGRGDEWRFAAELPDIVARLDRAAGLDHRELTGRSLWISAAK